jgi:hypothetical protein
MKMSAIINHSDNNFGEIFDYGSPLQWSMNLFSFNRNQPIRESSSVEDSEMICKLFLNHKNKIKGTHYSKDSTYL